MTSRMDHNPAPQKNPQFQGEDPGKQQLRVYQQLEQRMETGNQMDEKEEFASEFAYPGQVLLEQQRAGAFDRQHPVDELPAVSRSSRYRREDRYDTAMIIGWSAFAIALISLFFMPRFLGAVAIVLGTVAVFRGNRVGVWPVLIGFISLATSLMLLPFIP